MTKNEAMQMALIILLEYHEKENGLWGRTEDAIEALRTALAQPEQKQDVCAGKMPPEPEIAKRAAFELGKWLSAALSDKLVCKEYKQAINDWFDTAMPYPPIVPDSETPAFYGFMSEDGTQVDVCFTPMGKGLNDAYPTAYYTAPSKRKRLTDEEIIEIAKRNGVKEHVENLMSNPIERRVSYSIRDRYYLLRFVRALEIESAHGVKEYK